MNPTNTGHPMVSDASEVGLRRLVHHRITHPEFKDAGEVVAHLGAIQGQDYAGTKWAIGVRLPGSTDAAIEQALSDGVILRTWALRGTLHYVAPADIHWLLGLVGPRLIAGNASRYKQLELDEAILARSTAIIVKALETGDTLTRTELLDSLEANGISTAGQRGVFMLQRPGLERLIYQGPVRRNVTTFHILAEGTPLPKDQALAELARRYFTSRGPATLADFTQWSGLMISEARTGLAAVKSELAEERIEGQTHYLAPWIGGAPKQSLYLLPGFDEFVLGYKDRSAVLDPAHSDAICPGGNGMFMSTVVSNGRIIGTWKRTMKRNTVEIAFKTFRPLQADEMSALEDVAARYGAFLGLTAVNTFGE